MDILKLLKEGKTVESLTEDFFDALDAAQHEFEVWKKEQEEEKKRAAARAMEAEYKKQKLSNARKALGAAIIDYFEALDQEVTDATIEAVDWIIDVLPNIKVVKTSTKGWF